MVIETLFFFIIYFFLRLHRHVYCVLVDPIRQRCNGLVVVVFMYLSVFSFCFFSFCVCISITKIHICASIWCPSGGVGRWVVLGMWAVLLHN